MSKLGRLLVVLPLLALPACADPSGSTASTPTPAPTAATPESAAAAFATFAETGEGGRTVPWAATVRFSIAGEQVAQLGADFAARPEGWVRCPAAATEYEGRRCPVSALGAVRTIAREGGRVRVETEAPETVGCTTYRVPWEGAATTWIRPDEDHRGCFTDFAIAVATDDDGAIVAVDLVLSGP